MINQSLQKEGEKVTLGHLDSFFKAMSHDVRTPLHTIVLHGECLVDGLYGDLSDEQKEAVQKLADAGKCLTALVDNILMLPRMINGELGVCPSEVDLVESTQACVQALEDKAQSKNVGLVICSSIESAMVRCDRGMIDQVLIALIGFAIKASQGGCIAVSLSKDSRVAELCVRDSGITLTEEEIAEMLGPMETLMVKSHFRFEGREVCLALAKEIVCKHQGKFSLCCDDETGMCCQIELPLV